MSYNWSTIGLTTDPRAVQKQIKARTKAKFVGGPPASEMLPARHIRTPHPVMDLLQTSPNHTERNPMASAKQTQNMHTLLMSSCSTSSVQVLSPRPASMVRPGLLPISVSLQRDCLLQLKVFSGPSLHFFFLFFPFASRLPMSLVSTPERPVRREDSETEIIQNDELRLAAEMGYAFFYHSYIRPGFPRVWLLQTCVLRRSLEAVTA